MVLRRNSHATTASSISPNGINSTVVLAQLSNMSVPFRQATPAPAALPKAAQMALRRGRGRIVTDSGAVFTQPFSFSP